MISACIEFISHVCTDMDGSDDESQREWIISSGDSDISHETSPPPQIVCTQEVDLDRGSDSPATNPGPPADIPPDPASRSFPARERPYCDGLSLELAQQAIRRWRGPRLPEYATLARRTRTFYDRGWAAEGKPSAESIAAAGFFYDGRSKNF